MIYLVGTRSGTVGAGIDDHPSPFAADNEDVVEGTLSVQPQANPVRGFKEYFTNLTVEGNERNPWFYGEFNNQTITNM